MNSIIKKIKSGLLLMVASVAILSSCNKDLEQFPDNPQVVPTGPSLAATLAATPNDTLYNRILIKSGLASIYSNNAAGFTLFVPDNNAVRVFVNALSGIPLNAPADSFSNFITTKLSASTAASIVSYYTVPQKFTTAQFVHPFPNLELPTGFIAPQPAPANPLIRLRIYISKNPSTGIFYVNNIPLSGVDQIVGNSVIHHIPALVPPPQRMIFERINTDAELTIFKAALLRADSGVIGSPDSASSLVRGLQNFGANFTVFAPTNAAMKALLSALTGFPVTDPDAKFIGFLGSNSISTLNVKALVVYHFLGNRTASGAPISGIRVFTVNVPTTPIQVLTFLNNKGPAQDHPGVTLQAIFSGPSASSVTVKGLANATPSNVIINPRPDLTASYGPTPPATPINYTNTAGTSDQHYINGVLHYINQALRPL